RSLRGRDLKAPQLGLARVSAVHRKVVQTARAQSDRLGHAHDELGVGQPPGPLLETQAIIQHIDKADRSGRLSKQLRATEPGNRPIGRPNAYTHLGSASSGKGFGPRQPKFSLPRRPFTRLVTPTSPPYRAS